MLATQFSCSIFEFDGLAVSCDLGLYGELSVSSARFPAPLALRSISFFNYTSLYSVYDSNFWKAFSSLSSAFRSSNSIYLSFYSFSLILLTSSLYFLSKAAPPTPLVLFSFCREVITAAKSYLSSLNFCWNTLYFFSALSKRSVRYYRPYCLAILVSN